MGVGGRAEQKETEHRPLGLWEFVGEFGEKIEKSDGSNFRVGAPGAAWVAGRKPRCRCKCFGWNIGRTDSRGRLKTWWVLMKTEDVSESEIGRKGEEGAGYDLQAKGNK